MSKSKIINARTTELAAFIETGKALTAAKKKEYAIKWRLTPRTIERDIKKVKMENTHLASCENTKPENCSGLVKSCVIKLIETYLIGEGKTKTLRSIKINNQMEDRLCYPTYGDSLNANDKYLKTIFNISRKKTQDSLVKDSIALFERWLRRYKRQKNVANKVLRQSKMSRIIN